MSVGGLFLVHSIARRDGKEAFFFSRFNFTRMKQRGNTHYCFHCGGDVGFKPEKVGRLFKKDDISKPTNHTVEGRHNPMARHDASHADAVIGRAHKYASVWHWLECAIEKKKDFPYVVSVPQTLI